MKERQESPKKSKEALELERALRRVLHVARQKQATRKSMPPSANGQANGPSTR